jgi:hypothetical protein
MQYVSHYCCIDKINTHDKYILLESMFILILYAVYPVKDVVQNIDIHHLLLYPGPSMLSNRIQPIILLNLYLKYRHIILNKNTSIFYLFF